MALNTGERKAERKELSIMHINFSSLFFLLLVLGSLPSLAGCTSNVQKEAVLAVVDNIPITEGDLRYSLNIAHRREDLTSAGVLNLSDYVGKLVDERLIVNEARAAGMNEYPGVRQAVGAYILRESVLRLRDEEVVRKVSVSEEEMKGYYKENRNKFRIANLPGGEDLPGGNFEPVKRMLEKIIRKHKEQARSDEYLKYLREKASIKTDEGLISRISADARAGGLEKWKEDTRPLASVDGSVLAVRDVAGGDRSSFRGTPEDMVRNWIDRTVIDHEALGRHYEEDPALKETVRRYEDQVVMGAFIEMIILPRIVVNDEELRHYYSRNVSSFLKPVRYRVQRITVGSMDRAGEILNELQKGADFAWLARNNSIDETASKGGDEGWLGKEELPKSFSDIIDALNAGSLSPVIKIGSYYGIYRLQEKSAREPEVFERVKDAVFRAYVKEQVEDMLGKYVNRLKAEASIKVNGNEIRRIEEEFKR